MGVKRLCLLTCAAISTCVKSSSEISNTSETVDSYHPFRLNSFVPDREDVHVNNSHPELTDDDERGLTELAGEKMRALLYKMMGSKLPGAKSIASLMARLHFQHWARKGHSPLYVAELLKLSNDKKLVKLELLERYIAYLEKKKKIAGVTSLDAVVKDFGGEAEFVPVLFKYATQYPYNAQVEALLTELLAKWQQAKKPFEDVFAQFKFKEAGVNVFLDKRIVELEGYRRQYIAETGVQDVETLFSLLKREFGGEANLAFRAVDAMGYDATQKQGSLTVRDLFWEWEARHIYPWDLDTEVFAGMVQTGGDTIQAIMFEYRKFTGIKKEIE